MRRRLADNDVRVRLRGSTAGFIGKEVQVFDFRTEQHRGVPVVFSSDDDLTVLIVEAMDFMSPVDCFLWQGIGWRVSCLFVWTCYVRIFLRSVTFCCDIRDWILAARVDRCYWTWQFFTGRLELTV